MDLKVKLKQFDPRYNFFSDDGIFYPPRILFVASTGSGKSYLIRDILYKLKDTLIGGRLYSKTESLTNSFFDKHIP
jgi:hypothetical protein